MLKRFLKFFSNSDGSTDEMDHPHVHHLQEQEGEAATYLEFLLDKVEPRVEKRLQAHPSSDPVLEIATGILLELFPDYWDEVDEPLADDWSPRAAPSMPPPPGPGVPPPPPEAAGPPPAPGADAVVDEDRDDEDVAPVDEEKEEPVDEEPAADAEDNDEQDKVEIQEDSGDDADGSLDEESEPEEELADDDSDESLEEESEAEEIEGSEILEEEVVDEELADESLEEDSEAEEIEGSEILEEEVVDEELADEESAADEEAAGDEDDELDDTAETIDAPPPAGFVSAIEDTAEFEPPPISRGSVDRSVWPKSLGDPSVLHGARILLAVLLDNDRLPEGEQLSVGEVLMAADLWVHLIAQAVDLDDRVQKLARLVEKKFGANYFSQARLLLKLFPANTETRINNDRQLFYEDMILRMGIRRRHEVRDDDIDEMVQALSEPDLDDDEGVKEGLEILAARTQMRMHLYTRDPDEVSRWRGLAEIGDDPDCVPYLLEKIPPRRWRQCPVGSERPISQVVREHLVRPMAREHVINHLKTCYFILRAVGDTGLESYLDSFFDWSKECCDVDAIVLLPELHRRLTASTELIDALFGEVYAKRYRGPIEDALQGLDDAALQEAFASAIDLIVSSDVNAAAEGHFNLGGFILDAYLGFEYPDPSFAFKLHRLT